MTLAIFPGMKRLPYERMFLADSSPCYRCGGTGRYAINKRCLSCGGFGRLLTEAGILLHKSVCVLLVLDAGLDEHRQGRVDVSRIEHVHAKQLRPGMLVAPVAIRGVYEPIPMKLVATVEWIGESAARIRYTDQTSVLAAAYDLFVRDLTEDDLDRADVWLSQHVGRGAIEVEP